MSLPILTSSFVFISREQQRVIQNMDVNQIASHAFSIVYEDLATNKISYSSLEGSRQFNLEPRHLEDSSLWKGTFTFKKIKPEKPKETNYHVELWEVDFELESILNKENVPFAFQFILIRDLTHGSVEEKNNEKKA